MSFLNKSFCILNQNFLQKLDSRDLFCSLLLRLDGKKIDDIIDINFLDAALSNDETNVTSFIVLVERVDNGWFSEEVIFAEGIMLDNGAKLFN